MKEARGRAGKDCMEEAGMEIPRLRVKEES